MFSNDDRGAVTAELAVTIPTVLMVLALVLGSTRAGIDAITVRSLAHDVAVAVSRGADTDDARGIATAENATVHIVADCATVTLPAPWGMPDSLRASATSCAS